MNKILYAKSVENGGETLIEHSVAVMNFAVRVANSITKDKKIIKLVAIASLLHDIGKCTKWFQEKILGNEPINEDDLISHNAMGWAYLSRYTCLSNSKYNSTLMPILYHHPLSYNMSYDNNIDILSGLGDSFEYYEQFFDECCVILKDRFNIDLCKCDSNGFRKIDDFFLSIKSSNIEIDEQEWIQTIIRACLITSDRLCSSLSHENNKLICLNDKNTIEKYFNELTENKNIIGIDVTTIPGLNLTRLTNQLNIVDEIDKHHTSIIGASAGFGKTMIGLLWAIKNKKKVLWVCPRNIIAENTYASIKKELNRIGETNVKVNLLLTSEFKLGTKEDEDDITVTNIDNFLGILTNNAFTKNIYKMYSSCVIFDEYHEFVSNAPIFSGFIKQMRIRNNIVEGKTLLLSATPVKLEHMWDYQEEKTFRKSYDSQYKDNKIHVICPDNSNPFSLDLEQKDTCILVNSVTLAQELMYNNNDAFEQVYHTRYMPKDLVRIKQELIENHKENCDISKRKSVIATRIIGTGLDISWNNFIENVSSPELTIQGIGRINRFNECIEIPEIVLYHFNNNRSEATTISNMYDYNLSNKWYYFIKSKADNSIITIEKLYEIYNEFNEINSIELKNYYKKLYNESINGLALLTPKKTPKIKTKSKLGTTNTFRGLSDSYYAICLKSDDSGKIEEPIILEEFIIDQETSYDDNERNKLMKKFNITNKYRDRNKTLENFKKEAKNIDRPLFLVTKKYHSRYGLYDYLKINI